jgi:hypothetical protein
MVLLLVGLTISLLALAAPQAWATPDQNALLQTVPPEPVGGATVPASGLSLLAPVFGLVVVAGGAAAAVIVWRRSHS